MQLSESMDGVYPASQVWHPTEVLLLRRRQEIQLEMGQLTEQLREVPLQGAKV